MIALILIVVFSLWLIVPFVRDMMGYNQRDNLDVYKAYVELQRMRQYVKAWKAGG